MEFSPEPEQTLDSFLEESAGVGSFADEGQFTLSEKEAWKRLQHSLPHPEYWVLKLLQCAVHWKAERFCITTSDRDVSIDFECRSAPEEVEAADLLSAQFRGVGLQHLRVALAGVCADAKVNSVELRWTARGHTTLFNWEEGEVRLEEEKSVPLPRLVLQLRLRHQELSWFRSVFNASPFEAEERVLAERAKLCPIPVLLNSELIPFPSLELEKAPLLTQLESPAPPLLQAYYQYHRRLQLPTYMDYLSNEKTRSRRLPYGSHTSKETSIQVHWYFDGVLIDHWEIDPLESAIGGILVVDGQGLTLDLTGFAVRDDEASQRRLEATVGTRMELLEALADRPVEQILDHQVWRKQVKKSVLGLNLLVGIAFFPLLLVGLGELYRLPKKTREVLDEDCWNFQLHLEKRLQKLRAATGRSGSGVEADSGS